MCSSCSQLIFVSRAGWWLWYPRQRMFVFSIVMDHAFLGKDWEIILDHSPVVCCVATCASKAHIRFMQIFFLHPLPASSLPLGMQHVTDPPVPKLCGYWWGAAKGYRQKCISTNAGFSFIVYLCVRGWSAIILCMSDMNILSEKFICQGISCLSV